MRKSGSDKISGLKPMTYNQTMKMLRDLIIETQCFLSHDRDTLNMHINQLDAIADSLSMTEQPNDKVLMTKLVYYFSKISQVRKYVRQ